MSIKHLYHLVDRSFWPFIVSILMYTMCTGLVLILQQYDKGFYLFVTSIILLNISILGWQKDIIRESTYMGFHNNSVVRGLLIGITLFIISEICLFFALFWAYLHSAYNADIMQSTLWPAFGIDKINPLELPLLNTLLLLSAGFAITWAHHDILVYNNKFFSSSFGLFLGISMAFVFTLLQYVEFKTCSFDLSDSVYGSAFYMATTFHGFHVIFGAILLLFSYFRLHHFSNNQHTGLLVSLWYFHFTDLIWIILYIMMYVY